MSILGRAVVALMPLVPRQIVGRISRPYIAGETLDDAIARIWDLMDQHCIASLDILGEEVAHVEETEAFTLQYLETLDRIKTEGIESNISIKPTALGLNLDPTLCEANLRRLLARARELGNFVRIDMEDSSTTGATLDLYRNLRDDFDNVGVVLQAYLKRSLNDIEALKALKVNVRVCKGIYIESPEIAFRDPQRIRDSFMEMVESLLTSDCYVGIATHDRQLVERSFELIDRLRPRKDTYEFQMLLGVEPGLRREIVEAGHTMRVYVPYGAQWYAYSTRRLKENPAIAGHVFRALLSSKS
ncbi:proline dehydrogenase family protein [Candidatus Zixiibacteriota bacterium]